MEWLLSSAETLLYSAQTHASTVTRGYGLRVGCSEIKKGTVSGDWDFFSFFALFYCNFLDFGIFSKI